MMMVVPMTAMPMTVMAFVFAVIVMMMEQTQGTLLTERLYAAPLGLPVG